MCCLWLGQLYSWESHWISFWASEEGHRGAYTCAASNYSMLEHARLSLLKHSNYCTSADFSVTYINVPALKSGGRGSITKAHFKSFS